MKDLIAYLLGLPGLLAVLFILTCFYLYTGRINKAKHLSLAVLVFGLLFCSEFMGNFLGSLLIKNISYRQIDSLKDVDMIVIPSAGIEYQGEYLGWLPNIESYKAGVVAYDLQSKLADMKVPVLICGGDIEGGPDVVESDVIKSYFARQSAQIKKTLTEDISKTFYEQIWQCSTMLKNYGSHNPVLVIDELKMFRTLALFRARGVEMLPFPVFSLSQDSLSLRGLAPSLKGLTLNKVVVTEAMKLLLDLANQKISIANLTYKEKIKE